MGRWLACIAALASLAAQAAPGDERVLDDFASLAPWSVEASDGVHARLATATGPGGTAALCLEYDFGQTAGYAVARRALPLAWPANFEIDFDVRGEGAANALQVKLVDASGENVWWREMARFSFPADWQPLRVPRDRIAFAWGPAKDHALRETASLELAIARGEGRQGRACFGRLRLRERALPRATPLPIEAAASSAAEGAPAQAAVDGDPATAWRSDARGGEATLTLDLGEMREVGGLMLHWLPAQQATRFTVELSADGTRWNTVRRVEQGGGGTQPILLGDAEARYVRLHLLDGPARAYGLAEVEVRDRGFGSTPSAFFTALARDARRGSYPRGFSGEQSYWTVVGVDGGRIHALLSEDGALEPGPGEAALEPMLIADSGVVTWADVQASQALVDGYLPMPRVAWRHGDLALRVTAFATGDRARSQVVARYTVENHSSRAQEVTLALALRPFQVNPPTQFLNTPGGVALLRRVAWDGHALAIDARPRFAPLTPPDAVFTLPFDAGNLVDLLAAGRRDGAAAVDDETGLASGVMLYRLALAPHAARSVGIVVPLEGAPQLPRADAAAWMDAGERATAAAWHARLDGVRVHVPAAPALEATLRTALAHILVERSGPALQPGTRAYARSWIRDGALMSDALLRMGHADVVREFADWYGSHLFADGKVPCCVDRRGADPVAENDSAGEWIHLVDAYHRYTGDTEWLRAKAATVDRVLAYLDALRSRAPGPYQGLVAPSISHEGYSDRPAWSYWDDFWTLAGYDAAVRIATALNRPREARGLAAKRASFRHDLHASIRASVAAHGIDFIPGSADRGDFDATSTTIALTPAADGDALPRELLRNTFERYWREFVERRDGTRAWDAYTPYEWRNVGAFVRLGWRGRASEAADFFMASRRPAAWNQWAEVVGRDVRAARFVGDMPHAWVAADFIGATLDRFVYERERDRTLVLAAGVAPGWLEGEGVAIDGLRTPWGRLGYTLRRDGTRTMLTLAAGSGVPPGGFTLPWPWPHETRCLRVEGARLEGAEIRVARIPARVVIDSGACAAARPLRRR